MSGGLQLHDFDDGARCSFCSAKAVGPCAACARPVCGDCCTLTEGGAKVWAICLDCDRRDGRSLAGRWRGLLLWLGGILGGLAALVALLALVAWLARR